MRVTDYDVCLKFAKAVDMDFEYMKAILDGRADASAEAAMKLAAATGSRQETWQGDGQYNGPLRLISVKVWEAMEKRGGREAVRARREDGRGGCSGCD